MSASLAKLSKTSQRQKRAQVARACGNCRMRRIRCDNQVPCSNCALSQTLCSNSSAPPALTLTQANQEIALLKQKVQQLEAKLQKRDTNVEKDLLTITLPASVPGNPLWGGIHFRPARSPNRLWVGPSSLYSYIQRLSSFLSAHLDQEQPAHQLLPISASDNKLLDQPVAESATSLNSPSNSTTGLYLTPLQEDFFLNHFWQTYHVSLFPILNEAHFKEHYASLWMAEGKERRPSALVDIVVAMCMQYHISTLPPDSQGTLLDGKDALVAGRWHYWRGQKLLTYELESPSIASLQCYLLCAVYLCGGSFHNMMDSTVSLAVRTAYTLGLHLDPPSSMPEADRELRRRLWWAVYLMDSKAGMKLGRPFMLNDGASMPQLPSDTLKAASTSGSTFVPIDGSTTWLSFNLYQTKLYIIVRAAYNALFATDFHLDEGQTIWDNPDALRISAEVLAPHTQFLTDWADSVPQALQLKRQQSPGLPSSQPFSTDGMRLVLEPFAPHWLQRQRVLLELTYHHQCVNLYRPAISFQCRPRPDDQAETLALRCVAHAVALSKLLHQVLQETSLLNGWHEAFYSQWNAAMTLIGFLMVYPQSSMTETAREAIVLAIAVFDIFSAGFPVAHNASKIVQGLLNQADLLAAKSSKGFSAGEGGDYSAAMLGVDELGSQQLSLHGLDLSLNLDAGLLNQALDVDFWNNVDLLWPQAPELVNPGLY
ncbi:Zn(II)2Cys6 transcription factor [Aspergillus saccharolyticus JOP 1030-1]|uniref:Putative Zn(II)2Cys6 transcription factor n=1 Tax=Aspergillus saccharolyticus JOP 1030-1 TaxID=1450539 RepID=A0A319ASQ1_9EURO|nr:putative Zn(II)2Cys6 transcription factor [Aspergillus saccharolyticus JOP 1030-1]PYH49282.1 putative Zn(II)2Cys6 transcription factor [Aspergillus saccharolyticus JOP 1030-1]